MNVGDEEEHAVLLTNFFLGIGLKAWIIIGEGFMLIMSYYEDCEKCTLYMRNNFRVKLTSWMKK